VAAAAHADPVEEINRMLLVVGLIGTAVFIVMVYVAVKQMNKMR
jgi:hypothetical protein